MLKFFKRVKALKARSRANKRPPSRLMKTVKLRFPRRKPRKLLKKRQSRKRKPRLKLAEKLHQSQLVRNQLKL